MCLYASARARGILFSGCLSPSDVSLPTETPDGKCSSTIHDEDTWLTKTSTKCMLSLHYQDKTKRWSTKMSRLSDWPFCLLALSKCDQWVQTVSVFLLCVWVETLSAALLILHIADSPLVWRRWSPHLLPTSLVTTHFNTVGQPTSCKMLHGPHSTLLTLAGSCPDYTYTARHCVVKGGTLLLQLQSLN